MIKRAGTEVLDEVLDGMTCSSVRDRVAPGDTGTGGVR
jgi:hypothetical protein